ncbi:hypothetical protein [Beggiatoa leptomitoformis]|nr:hypothetical protein [Beggiatoa leptomitoformis]
MINFVVNDLAKANITDARFFSIGGGESPSLTIATLALRCNVHL